jgi:hypothetical protein
MSGRPPLRWKTTCPRFGRESTQKAPGGHQGPYPNSIEETVGSVPSATFAAATALSHVRVGANGTCDPLASVTVHCGGVSHATVAARATGDGDGESDGDGEAEAEG